MHILCSLNVSQLVVMFWFAFCIASSTLVAFFGLIGMETDSSYEQRLMPEGRLSIDGFLCCFDVSQVS